MTSTIIGPVKSARAFGTRSYARSNGAICLLAPAAQTVQASGEKTPALMDQPAEIALALSACPPSVANKAAVYVLSKDGYIKIRETQNGFTAIVQHSLLTSQEPQCMDAEGTRTILQRMLMVASLRAQGKSADEIKQAVAAAVRGGCSSPPPG